MLKKIYNILLKTYGYQGWWPLQSHAGKKGFDNRGYHPEDYLSPVNFKDKFDIIAGAILTQNTSWTNVEKSLKQLSANKLLTPQNIMECPETALAALIKSSGYYNQKAKKLKTISGFILENKLEAGRKLPTRESLLDIWGVGEETADSILLYAYRIPVFVVDAYTKRILGRIGLVEKSTRYTEIQNFFQAKLPADYALFNEYHALIVSHGKNVCKAKPDCIHCPLKKLCTFGAYNV